MPQSQHQDFSRRGFLKISTVTTLAAGTGASCTGVSAEWRNRQNGMTYRRLGRTNFMVSAFAFGGSPILEDSVRHLEYAVERGLNYLDTASGYENGEGERRLGNWLQSSGARVLVFLASKVTPYNSTRNRNFQQVYEELTDAQRRDIDSGIEAEIEAGNLLNDDYNVNYLRTGRNLKQIRDAFRTDTLLKQYPDKVLPGVNLTELIVNSAENSLKNLQTDYLDILHCPHATSSPGEMKMDAVQEAFLRLRQSGKVRYFGATAHGDPASMLESAAKLPYYDVAQPAFNYINHRYFETALRAARAADLGVICMKAAKWLNDEEECRRYPEKIERLRTIIPGDMADHMKAYLWVQQQPVIAIVNASMMTEEHVAANLSLAGMHIDLPENERVQVA